MVFVGFVVNGVFKPSLTNCSSWAKHVINFGLAFAKVKCFGYEGGKFGDGCNWMYFLNLLGETEKVSLVLFNKVIAVVEFRFLLLLCMLNWELR